MKPLHAIIAAVAFVAALPVLSNIAPKQNQSFALYYSKGQLNGNICAAKGKTCNLPKKTS